MMEISHRDVGGPVQNMMKEAELALREVLKIPENFHVLFLHGGAHGQFTGVPMNFLRKNASADYVVTGFWSARAHEMASRAFPQVRKIDVVERVSGKQRYKDPASWPIDENAAYVHICASETIDGIEFLEDVEVLMG